MKLILAISVIVATLCVLAEPSSADSSDPTVKERFDNFGETVKDAVKNFGEKAKSAITRIHESEPLTKARSWFSEQFQKIKNKVHHLTE